MVRSDFRSLLHTPEELAIAHVKWAEQMQTGKVARFGIPALDKLVIPMHAGDLVGIIGRPGMAKTSILAYLARYHAKQIQEQGSPLDEAVVYVSWEQSVEELEAFFQSDGETTITDIAWGRASLDNMRKRANKRVFLPIWMIGHSVTKRHDKPLPRMTLSVVLETIELMKQDFGVRPALLLFDYMQLIPVPRARDRIQQVTEVPHRVKEVALRVAAPAVVGVQAGRDVDKYDFKMPKLKDAQWASSIEQTCDKVFGLWRPCLTETVGSWLELPDGRRVQVTESLLLIAMLKQRGDKGQHLWLMYFDPATLRLAEMEIR